MICRESNKCSTDSHSFKKTETKPKKSCCRLKCQGRQLWSGGEHRAAFKGQERRLFYYAQSTKMVTSGWCEGPLSPWNKSMNNCNNNNRSTDWIGQCGVKPKLSTMKRDHRMDGWLLCARLCTCLEISPESSSVKTLWKFFGWDYRSPMCIHVQNGLHMHV